MTPQPWIITDCALGLILAHRNIWLAVVGQECRLIPPSHSVMWAVRGSELETLLDRMSEQI